MKLVRRAVGLDSGENIDAVGRDVLHRGSELQKISPYSARRSFPCTVVLFQSDSANTHNTSGVGGKLAEPSPVVGLSHHDGGDVSAHEQTESVECDSARQLGEGDPRDEEVSSHDESNHGEYVELRKQRHPVAEIAKFLR